MCLRCNSYMAHAARIWLKHFVPVAQDEQCTLGVLLSVPGVQLVETFAKDVKDHKTKRFRVTRDSEECGGGFAKAIAGATGQEV